MNADKLNKLYSEALPMCNDLNGAEEHFMEWLDAGNKDGVFDGMSAAQVAKMWNDQMVQYRNEQGE